MRHAGFGDAALGGAVLREHTWRLGEEGKGVEESGSGGSGVELG